METYLEFLRSKIVLASETGFTLPPEEINPALKPHQRDAVVWALRGGRRALFESFGLGKTVQELEFCHQAVRHEGGKALIVLPLGVRQEFTRDAVELLHYAAPEYITSMAEADSAAGDILMTNYERVRDGDIDPTRFTAVALDEASVLRSFGSKTYQMFLPKFQGVKYKLVSTATPSPNRYKELIHYAGYLEIMDTGQALTRFFQRDSTKANNLTLYPHKEDEFWLWVSSWALFIGKPSDLGYDDTGYALPPLDVRTHIVRGRYGEDADRDGQFKLMHDAAVSLAEASREKRESIDARVAAAKEIVDSDPEAHFILWHDLEAAAPDYPQGVCHIRKAAELPTAVQCAARAALRAPIRQCRGSRGSPLAFLWGFQRGYSLWKENTPFAPRPHGSRTEHRALWASKKRIQLSLYE